MSTSKEEIESQKLVAEIKKLEIETATARDGRLRGWITTVSIAVGVIVSAAGIYQSLAEVAYKNRQLGLQAEVQSHQIFLNEVLDRLSGEKVVRYATDSNGELTLASRDMYGDVTRLGAYGAAIALACRFPNLILPAQAAFTFQLAAHPTDVGARDMLDRLDSNCQDGWDRLGPEQRSDWPQYFQYKAADTMPSR